MGEVDDLIKSLRQALELSPRNLSLRLHVADTLLAQDRAEDAEKEYRQALALAPDDVRAKLGLAHAFYRQGRGTHALVVLEDLLKLADPPPRARLLHARLLLGAGDRGEAGREYARAIAADPSLADRELDARLGARPPAAPVKRPAPAPGPTGQEDDGLEEEEDEGDDLEERVPAGAEGEPSEEAGRIERPSLRFADVGGMEALKEEIRLKIIHPLAHPELYKAYGKAAGGGILMYGPPGCGKTHLARATAGEIDAAFLAIGINDVLDMWLGNSERNLHEIFDQARRNRPCVLFFDEVDALAASRADFKTSAMRQVINVFLAELDGIRGNNEGVLVLAATNAPWHIDTAFRRPGRFDRILFVPPPDPRARSQILRLLCQGKPADAIDFEDLAKRTADYSGADLKAIVDVAIERKLREAVRDGVPRPLGTKDFAAALGTVKPSTREWFSTARNYAIYSNQGGLYDDILKYLKM